MYKELGTKNAHASLAAVPLNIDVNIFFYNASLSKLSF